MAAPELRLEVSLNLLGFRNEIRKLTNIAQSEFVPKINVKFNRQTLDAELNNLQRAIKRRVYRVEIGGNIDSLPDKIKNLKEQLASIESLKIDLGIGAVKSLSKKDASKIKSDLRAEILGEQKKLYIPTSIQAKISRDDIRDFKNAVKSKLTGLSVDVKVNAKDGGFAGSEQGAAGLMQYMRSQGMVGKTASGMEMRLGKGGDDIKQQLSDAVRSAEKIKSVFDGVAKNIATTGKSIASVQGKRLGLANVPLMAGAMEKRIERSASAIEGTASFDALKSLYPEINKTIVSLAALRGQVQQNTSKLSGFSLIIGLAAFAGVPLAKSIVRLTGSADKFSKLLDELGPRLEAALTKAASNILNATSSRLLSGSSVAGLLSAGSVAGLLPPAYRGIGPSAGPAGLLPPAYRGIGPSAKPAGLLPSLSSAGRSNAIIEALIASTGPRLLPSGGGDDSLGKLAAPRQTKDAIDAILRNYFKVLEVQVKEVFSAPPVKKESLNIFDHLDTEQYFNYLAQARINAENAIKQSIEEGKQVAKQNRVKDAAQSFLRALEENVRNAERSMFLQSRIAANQSYVQRANIREIGQPLLGGRQVTPPKMLSAATGFYRGAATPPPLPETQAQLFARREREARMRSVLRGVDVMGETPTRAPARYSYANRPAMPRRPTSAIVPYEAGGALVPSGGGGGGVPPVPPRGGGGGGGFFGGMQFNMPQLPGAGLVREIGTEFGFAAKQVLLFGTAYKALAFIQGFPAQVGDAVGALQSFRNTLGAISPSAEEAAESSQFILDIVDKYNTPIQSARDGFTKLYASMKPTGFSGDEIRDLFLGISQAAATFGMSAEKVDRVNYAFAQMASKGQVMSEELKGQLGDVLPGAMGIFAEAAGFTGPDAITKFSKALEDGAYKGAAMKTLLTNVGIVMRKEFGPGAEGAARTFQGVINRMQNSFKLLYESFEPVAVGFLNSVVMPLTSGIKTVTDGFNAFFTGTLAKTEGGAAFAQQLNNLKPSFEGIRTNLAALIPSFQTFGQLLLSVAQFLTQLAGNPITGFLLKVYTNVLLVNTAFTLLGGRILLGLIANVNAAIIRFVAFGYAINAVGIQTTGANTALAGTQLQMMLLQRNAGAALAPVNALLASLASIAAIGTIAVVLTIAISNMNELRDAEARLNRLRGAKADSVVGPTGPRPVQTAQARFTGASRETIEEARGKQTKYLTELTIKRQALERKLQTAQGENLAAMADANSASIITAGNRLAVAQANFNSINEDIKNAQEVLRLDPRNYPRQADINRASTPGISVTSGGGDGGKDKGADDAKRLREEIARQAAAASDALFAEQQRFLILQQTNPIAEAIAKYTSEEASIQRKLNAGLKEAQSEKEKIDLKEAARLQGAANRLELEQSINDEAEKALKPIADLLASQREELALTTETEKLMKEGISPERAKQIAQVRLLVKQQLEALDLSIDQADAAITEARARGASAKAVEDLIAALDRLKEKRREGEEQGKAGEEGVPKDKPKDYLGDALTSAEARLKELLNPAYQLAEAAKTIGDSFGEAFKGIITGSMTVQEAFAGLFQSIADRFADMVAEMIARWLEAQLIKGFLSLFPGAAPAAEASQAVLRFADGGVASGGFQAFASGGIASGGFQAFADGGIVSGPTLGLVGEGRYNEAVIPLPDGKSVPVDLGGMAGGMGGEVTSNIVVNINNGQMQGNGNSNGSELGRKIEGAVKQVLVSELRPGGILSSGRR
jgi:tape measure domain-containing protein